MVACFHIRKLMDPLVPRGRRKNRLEDGGWNRRARGRGDAVQADTVAAPALLRLPGLDDELETMCDEAGFGE